MAAASSLNGPNPHNGSFGGMALKPEQARLILIAMPWEATVSYGTGTSRGPQAILDASPKMDFHNELFPDFWKKAGLTFLPPAKEWQAENDRIRPLAARAIAAQEGALQLPPQDLASLLDKVNTSCTAMTAYVEHEAARWLAAGKVVGVVGGDHSCPLGLIRALAKKHANMGILHIDAHADLREVFEGFPYSHASVMFNALKEPADPGGHPRFLLRGGAARHRVHGPRAHVHRVRATPPRRGGQDVAGAGARHHRRSAAGGVHQL